MSHFALLWKARTIEKYRQNYENEKINSIIMSSSDVPDKTLLQRWRHYKHGMQKRLSRTFSKWYPEGGTVSNFLVNLRADMKLPNILLRGLYGFIGGLLLTYLGFMFFVFQLSVSVIHATVLSSILGVLLTLGLTFSDRMRYLILLLVPQLFSRVGRYTLTCYALVLILTGPATNTLKNSEVLSESMACTQEHIKLSVRQINESIKKPYNSLKESLNLNVVRMNSAVRKLKAALITINKLILSVASVIQSGYSWLEYMTDTCNEALGTPYNKCLTILNKHCTINDEHNKLSNVKPKRKKKNIIKEILRAFGIKNLNRHEESAEDDLNKHRDIFKRKVPGFIDNLQEHETNNDAKLSSDTKVKSDTLNDKDKLPWFCNVAKVVESACDSLRSYEKFCVAADFVGDTFLATIRKKVKTFVERIDSLIYVKLNIQHSYTLVGNSSSPQVSSGVITDIRNKADPIFTWLAWSSAATSLFLLLIVFRAKHYQHMFDTRSRFDNRFITKEFRELDLKRLREGRETVLPLNTRERAKYVTTTSFRLVASEKLHLNRSAVFMTVATFKLLIHIVADYSLYWVLTTIRQHGKFNSTSSLQPGILDTGVVVTGSGFVARLLQALVDTMNVQLLVPQPDHSCVLNPYPPDIKGYCQIGFIIFLLWFFALFEPYGLRLRHLIMGHYRPQRAKDRAVWLYNHILRTRASFMKFARRKLHREFKYSSHKEHTFLYKFLKRLVSNALLRWLSALVGLKPNKPYCLLCNAVEDLTDSIKELVKCEVPDCPGTFCQSCFSDIGELCTICLSPSDYGDFSDVSLERGSSDEESDDDDNYRSGNYSSNETYTTSNDSFGLEEIKPDNDNSKRNEFTKVEGQDTESQPLLKHNLRLQAGTNEQISKDTKKITNYMEVITNEFIFVSNYKYKLFQNNMVHLTKRNPDDKIYIISKTMDINCNNICFATSTIEIFQYSVYKITNSPLSITRSEYTTSIAKYLRKKKVIRQKKCSYERSEQIITAGNNKAKDTKNTKKNGNSKSQRKDPNNHKKSKKSNKSKNIPNMNLKNVYDENELDNYANNNKNTNIKERKRTKGVDTMISRYWQNIKSTMLDKNTMKVRPKANTTENKHKRKKKRKKTEILTTKGKKTKLNEREVVKRNSRLFAFLDERDWANSCDNGDIKEKQIKEDVKPKKNKIKDDNIVVNNIVIPRLNLTLSSDSLHYIKIKKPDERKNPTPKRLDLMKSTIERFFKLITSSSYKLFKTCSDGGKTRNTCGCIVSSEPDILMERLHQSSGRCKNAKSTSIQREPPKKEALGGESERLRIMRLLSTLLLQKQRISGLISRKRNKNTNTDAKVEKATHTELTKKRIKKQNGLDIEETVQKNTKQDITEIVPPGQTCIRQGEKINIEENGTETKRPEQIYISQNEQFKSINTKQTSTETKPQEQAYLIQGEQYKPIKINQNKTEIKRPEQNYIIQNEQLRSRHTQHTGTEANLPEQKSVKQNKQFKSKNAGRNENETNQRALKYIIESEEFNTINTKPVATETKRPELINCTQSEETKKHKGTEIFTQNDQYTDHILEQKQIKNNIEDPIQIIDVHVNHFQNKCVQCKSKREIGTQKSAQPKVTNDYKNAYVEKVNRVINFLDETTQTVVNVTETDHKGVTASPVMAAYGCQAEMKMPQADTSVQVNVRRKPHTKTCKDANVMTFIQTCTCAAQCREPVIREASTVPKRKRDGSKIKKKKRRVKSESTVETFMLDRHDDCESNTTTTVCHYADISYPNINQHLNYRNRSQEQDRKSDTIGRLTYRAGRLREQTGRLLKQDKGFNEKFGPLRVRVVTKSNQSTLTNRTTHCDVSTSTYDWWSPIIERKEITRKSNKLEKRRKDCCQPRLREKRSCKSKGISTRDKMVTFRSKTQFIPSKEKGFGDVLSPSRYLLESQRYYNELFYNILSSPRVYPVANFKKNNDSEREWMQNFNNSQQRRRGYKTKRLEKSYSPKKI